MPFDLREHLDPGATVSLERSEEEGLGEPWQEKRGHQTIQSLARDKAAWTPPPRLRVGVAEPFWACRPPAVSTPLAGRRAHSWMYRHVRGRQAGLFGTSSCSLPSAEM